MSNYITTTYGISNGTYNCYSNINSSFANTSSLNKGLHLITCIAKGNNGLSAETTNFLTIANNTYVKNTADELVLTLNDYSSDRFYYKGNSIPTLAGLCNYAATDLWLGPVFVSKYSDGTNYYTNGNHEANVTGNFSFEYKNQLWYVSPNAVFYRPSEASIVNTSLQNITVLAGVTYFENEIECAKKIIDLAIQ